MIKYEKIIATVFFVIGICLLAMTFLRVESVDSRQVEKIRALVDLSVIKLESADIKKSSHVALFVLNDKVCPPCLTEVDEYAKIIQQSRGKYSALPIAIVVGENEVAAARFAQVANLPVPVHYANVSELPNSIVDSEAGSLVFVRTRTGIVTHRLVLPNSVVTPAAYKHTVLETVFPE